MYNTKELFDYDKSLLNNKIKYIAGIDEVGRGPLAGPVVTACVVMPYDEMIDGVLHVHMIDCGQGDCFLFEYEGLYGMIDCGTQDSKDKVIEYLDNQKVTKLEFIVGTHQHEDHMGGASAVIDKYEVETIYEPNIGDYAINTKWYKKYNYIVENKKIPVKKPKVGDKFYLGETVFEVIGQLNIDEAGNNLNNVSTVIKVTLGQMDILMTGDAETAVEEDATAE